MSAPARPVLREIDATTYAGAEGHRLAREDAVDAGGTAHRGIWVYRLPDGRAVDMDRYRHDLEARCGFTLAHAEP